MKVNMNITKIMITGKESVPVRGGRYPCGCVGGEWGWAICPVSPVSHKVFRAAKSIRNGELCKFSPCWRKRWKNSGGFIFRYR